MPTVKDDARPVFVHADAVKLAALKASLDAVNEQIPQQVVIGNNITALRARRSALADEIAELQEQIDAYPLSRRESEQPALYAAVVATREVRAENYRKAAEANAQSVEYERLAAESAKEAIRLKNGPDGYWTALQAYERHVARFGDLSGGTQ